MDLGIPASSVPAPAGAAVGLGFQPTLAPWTRLLIKPFKRGVGAGVPPWTGLSAVLFLMLLLAVSAAVQCLLVDSRPLPAPEEEVAGVSMAREEATAAGAAISAVPGAPAATQADYSAPRPASAPALMASTELSPEGLVYDRRGLWITDSSRGKVARLDRGPVPRQSVLLPVLMYHHVAPIDFSRSTAFASDLTVPPTEFELQLRYLRDRGFQSASLDDLALFLQGRKDLPPLSVVLTFDDGYQDNYLYAYPLLKRYGFTGTFFIITGLVGQKDYMAWRQLLEMATGGMEIGSHTLSHPDLAFLPAAQRDRELTESKRLLQDTLGVTVRALSYPSGSFNQEVAASARRAGYAVAVTTRYGATLEGARPMELPRVRIHGRDTLPVFRWRIEQYFPTGEPSKGRNP